MTLSLLLMILGGVLLLVGSGLYCLHLRGKLVLLMATIHTQHSTTQIQETWMMTMQETLNGLAQSLLASQPVSTPMPIGLQAAEREAQTMQAAQPYLFVRQTEQTLTALFQAQGISDPRERVRLMSCYLAGFADMAARVPPAAHLSTQCARRSRVLWEQAEKMP